MLIAVVSIYAFLKIKGKATAVKGKMRYYLYGAGAIIALHWITFFHAIKISNVSITLACMGSGAFFVALLEPLFFRRKIALSEILMGLFVVIGIATIFSSEAEYSNGIYVGLLSASLSALFSVINGKLVQKEAPSVITVHELFGGWLAIALVLLVSIATGNRSVESIIPIGMDWVYLLLLGVVATAYAFIQSVEVMKHLSPFTVVLSINMEPVYGILAAYFILQDSENMSPEFYFGTLIILSSVISNGWIKRKRKRTLA